MKCPACGGQAKPDREGMNLCAVCGAQEFVIPNTDNYGWRSPAGRIVAAPADEREAHDRMMEEWGDHIVEEPPKPEVPDRD